MDLGNVGCVNTPPRNPIAFDGNRCGSKPLLQRFRKRVASYDAATFGA